jgi:hypothetical protein
LAARLRTVAFLCFDFFGAGFFGAGFLPVPGFVGAGEPVVIVTGPFAATCGPFAIVVVVVTVTTTMYVVLLMMICPHCTPAALLTLLLGRPVVPVPGTGVALGALVPGTVLVAGTGGAVGAVEPGTAPVPGSAAVPTYGYAGAGGTVTMDGALT